MVYQFKQEQHLPISLEDAWSFFSDPNNLSKITPPNMQFKILNGEPKPMYAGQIILYKVSPFLGIQTNWLTEITHVREPFYFVDEQRKGPYNLWHHQHLFTKTESGVLMQDIVTYELPLGILGQFVHFLFVKKRLQRIFEYRKQYLDEKFSTSQ